MRPAQAPGAHPNGAYLPSQRAVDDLYRVLYDEEAMTAPVGAVVKLYVDLVQRVRFHDTIETQTGRRYVVMAVREQQTGKHAGRQHLTCVVIADGDFVDEPGVQTHKIRWYKRNGRRYQAKSEQRSR